MFPYSLCATIFYIAGMILSPSIYETNAKLFTLMFTAFVLLPLLLVLIIKKKYKMRLWIIFIIPFFLFSGIYIPGIRTDILTKNFRPFEGQNVTLHGTVISDVKKYDSSCSYIMRIKKLECNDSTYKINSKIKISSSDIPSPGDCITVNGELKKIKEKMNSTSYDKVNHYAQQNIFHSLFSETVEKSDTSFHIPFNEQIALKLNTTFTKFTENTFDTEDAAMLKGIILNNKSEIPDDTYTALQQSGTGRYIYSSYLHIFLIIYFITNLKIRRNKRYSIISIFLVIYLLFNTGKPSAWKLCIFLIVTYYMVTHKDVRENRTSVVLTILITAILSPNSVFNGGFIISVSATALMSACQKYFYPRLRRFIRYRKLTAKASSFVIISVLMSPLMQFLGYSITPYSYLAGIILFPLMCFIYILIPIQFAAYIISDLHINLGIPLLLKIIKNIAEFTAGLPGSSLIIPPTGLLFIIAFYLCMYALVLRDRKQFYYKRVSVCAIIMLLISSGVMYSKKDLAEITFLNVGHADCCVIKLPTGENIMLDGGGSPAYADYNIGDSEVIPFLQAKGICKLDYIILSHYDKDHSQGVISAIKYIDVKNIFLPDYPDEDKDGYKKQIENEAKLHDVKLNYITRTTRYHLAEDFVVNFIRTERQKNSKSGNDSSLISHINYKDIKLLFTGDISREIESDLKDVDCDILKIPHHGSKYSTGKHLLKETTPTYAIFTVADNNPYGHPAPTVIDRCTKDGINILRTDVCGNISFYINQNGIKNIKTFKKMM